MRTFQYTRSQLIQVHNLRHDADNSEIDQARQNWQEEIRQDLDSFARATNVRLDAGEGSIIALELEHQFSRMYDRKYPEYKARTLIPGNNEASNADETWAYKFWDSVGMAKIISDFADDLPRVGAFAQKFTGTFKSMGNSYDYDLQELRSAAKAGTRLQDKKAVMARRGHEALADTIFAFGHAETGATGFVNNANVPVVSSGITGGWNTATPSQILADMQIMERTGPLNSFDVFSFDTLVLPIDEFQIISGTFMTTDNNTSVLDLFLKASPYIRNVESWSRLATANTAGTGPRGMMYKRDPEVCELVESQAFEQMPPQVKNLSWVVPCHSRIGGVKIVYPLGMAYVDLE